MHGRTANRRDCDGNDEMSIPIVYNRRIFEEALYKLMIACDLSIYKITVIWEITDPDEVPEGSDGMSAKAVEVIFGNGVSTSRKVVNVGCDSLWAIVKDVWEVI